MSETTTTATADDTSPIPDLRSSITREAALKTLLDKVKEAYAEARTDVQAAIDAEQQRTGGRQFAAMLPGDEKVGTVSLTDPDPVATITERDAFVEWCREQFPAEATTYIVKDVRKAFIDRLLAEMTAAGVARVTLPAEVNETTGEISGEPVTYDVPGVQIRATRSRGHSVRFAKGGREAVEQAWREGRLADLVLPALAPAPPAEQSEGAQ